MDSNSIRAEARKRDEESEFAPKEQFVKLVKHAISCQCDFGKCPVPGCAVTQRIMSFLSPSVARKRMRIEQQAMNRKRARVQQTSKKSAANGQKVVHRVSVPPAKGDFVHMRVEYYLGRCNEYNPLLSTLTKAQLSWYISFLKARYVSTFYSPLLQMLMQHKDNHGIFNVPVDPERQNLPTYYSIVQQPMDLGTIRDRLACGKYTSSRDLVADIRLVFQNAKKFNPPTHFIAVCATSLLKLLDTELEKIRARVEQNRATQSAHCCSSCHGYPCRLCGEKCLKYSPPVYVCDGDCHERILRNATYYIIRGKKGRYCQKCYAKKVAGMDKVERKNLFVRKKNDEVFPESWIQCSRCREWMHCVCGLIHPRQASSTYVCPICLIEDPHRVPKPLHGAQAIARCPLSDYLTESIAACVDEEVVKWPARMRPTREELAELKASLVIRVVSNITASVAVKPALAPMYTSRHSAAPLIIPYQSKCIAFFQHRNGVDILLFVLYVHEFDERAPAANQRCVYISYLDSVHFLAPRSLRTPVYHTILSAYLQYAKDRGFCRAHIWACPPSRGDDYIFSHHPRDQRTPNADHLINWYRSLLATAAARGTVSHITCQLDELLHVNALHTNNPDIIQRQIQCLSIHGPKETDLPESVLERVQSTASTVPQSPQSSDYESEMSNDNDNESESSSELSSLSTATSVTLPSDASPRQAAPAAQIAPIMPASGFSELERVLLLLLPYFEGDYLPYIGEDLLKEIYQDALKPKTPRGVGVRRSADT